MWLHVACCALHVTLQACRSARTGYVTPMPLSPCVPMTPMTPRLSVPSIANRRTARYRVGCDLFCVLGGILWCGIPCRLGYRLRRRLSLACSVPVPAGYAQLVRCAAQERRSTTRRPSSASVCRARDARCRSSTSGRMRCPFVWFLVRLCVCVAWRALDLLADRAARVALVPEPSGRAEERRRVGRGCAQRRRDEPALHRRRWHAVCTWPRTSHCARVISQSLRVQGRRLRRMR